MKKTMNNYQMNEHNLLLHTASHLFAKSVSSFMTVQINSLPVHGVPEEDYTSKIRGCVIVDGHKRCHHKKRGVEGKRYVLAEGEVERERERHTDRERDRQTDRERQR